jgi:hypothetical protein
MEIRGTDADEVAITIERGERFPAKHGRTGFRRNFAGRHHWRGREFDTKQLEVYAVYEDDAWLAITVIVKFF